MATLSLLAVSVASGRVGYVYMEGTQLRDWAVTTTVCGQSTDLVAFVQELINTLKPDIVVTEKCDDNCKKGNRTRDFIHAMARLASQNYVLDISVPRPRLFPSKHEEAVQMVERHPDLVGYLPNRKRRSFDFEPRNMIVFEALALAEAVIFGPPEQLAAVKG